MKLIALITLALLVNTAVAKPKGRGTVESGETAFSVDTKGVVKEECLAKSQCVGKGLVSECSKWALDNAHANAKEKLADCLADMKRECDTVGGKFETAEASPYEFVDDGNAAKGTAVVISRNYTCNACAKK